MKMKCRNFNINNESRLIRQVLLENKIFPLLASILFLASCDASDLRPKRGGPPPMSHSRDRYACQINDEGYCIFTGSPHQTGLKPGTEQIINANGEFLFWSHEALASDASGNVLEARGKPTSDGDELMKSSQENLTDDEKVFHRVMAIMYPIRNALMYDIAELTQIQWDTLLEELTKRKIKETTFTEGDIPRDNYYGRQGIFELAKDPDGQDIHHEVMRFLEESSLYLLCHTTSEDFNEMLKETHPEGHDPCGGAGIEEKIGF